MNIKKAPVFRVSPSGSRRSLRHQSIISPSHVHVLDRYLHSERAACHLHTVAQQRDRIKRQGHQKAAKIFLFFIPHTSSFHFSLSNLSTPNHQPRQISMSLLGIPFSFRRGPRIFSLSVFFSSGGFCHFIRACRSHQSANFIVQMRGHGQVSTQDSPESRGPVSLVVPCTTSSRSGPALILGFPSFPLPLCPLRTRDALEVSNLFARTLGSPRGVRYPLQEPLSSAR